MAWYPLCLSFPSLPPTPPYPCAHSPSPSPPPPSSHREVGFSAAVGGGVGQESPPTPPGGGGGVREKGSIDRTINRLFMKCGTEGAENFV